MVAPGMSTARDVPLLILSTATSSERRISPSWSIALLKTKLEPITGIPPSAQRLTLQSPGHSGPQSIEAEDEEATQLAQWTLTPYAELKVTATDPSAALPTPAEGSVPKIEMPLSQYEQLPDTVLDYKKRHQIGRFDPAAPEKQDKKVKSMWAAIDKNGIQEGARCRLSDVSSRRGTVKFIGVIASLPGLQGAPWVGVALDEPSGKNDGSINGERYFQTQRNHGIFVRAERVEVGNFAELGLEDDPDMEEL